MRSLDWSTTPLGLPDTWPQSLRSAVGICLGTNYPIAIYWGPELALLYNDAWSEIPGEKHPWALGRPGRDVWPEIWDAIGPLFEKVQATGEGVWQEDQLLPMHRHGYTEECYFNFTFSPIRGENGDVEGIFNAVVETTFRVIGERRERTLRDLAERLAGARAEDEVFASSLEVLGLNPQDVPFCLVYRLDPGEAEPRLVGSAGLDASSVVWPLDLLLESKGPVLVENLSSQLGADIPSTAWPEAVERALLVPFGRNSHTGAPAGFLVAGISPRRAVDADYEAFVERAAAHVGTSLANVRAFEDERRRAETLAEIDRAKTAFFSNVSHEFRTPLTLMLGPIEDALDDPDILPRERERIEVVHRNGLRLLKLVNSLLDFSRVEAGRAQANLEPVDLAKLTADLASNFRSAMEKAGLTYSVACKPLSRPVLVDRDMWEKIVLNLLSNAFKFTFVGEVVIELGERDGQATLTVRDTGTGIPSVELPRLFERFHRIEGARGRSIEGSGIGLALVQELVRFHGGTVTVESEEGKGTSFIVVVPLDQSRIAPQDDRSQTTTAVRAEAYVEEAMRWLPDDTQSAGGAAADNMARAPEGAPRILLADDNADMRDYVQRLLAGAYHVDIAEDGVAALEALRERRHDLLLTDIMMPRLDGFGLIKAIREDPDLGDLPIIALSARAGEEARVDGLEAGADDYLVKPFSARELIATVRANLELTKFRREANSNLRRQAARLESLNKTAGLLAGQLDLDQVVQTVTDSGVALTGAQFGAFFYNVVDDKGESYMLYTLSGVPRSEFSKFPMPRNTKVFAPTFEGRGVVRSDDITADERYGQNEPHRGMPKGHLPVRSYLAVPVMAPDGNVVGGLFFGHAERGRFSADHEALVVAVAGQAAVAIENARLFKTAQKEIEQRKHAEARLEELNWQLQDLIGEAVERAKNAEQALLQSQKMEAIGQLTGGIAHDFNNLLQVVSGNLQLLGRDIAELPAAQKKVANALEGVARGSKLASQLLSFGRRQPLEPKVVNIGRFVAGMEDMLQRTLGEAIEVEIVRSGGLWNTFVDVVQVENAILNLAINARDAMEGSGKLTIEVGNAFLDDAYASQHDEVEAGQYVMLALTDTGSGMSPDILAKVFDPFFTTKPVGKGTGLGLSMVHGFVKQSGGHLKLYSEVGEGTSVKLYFPRSHQQEDTVVVADHGPVVGGTETILVAEDDEQVRETVVSMLTDLGYRVLKAKDASAALIIIESGVPIDLLFTDVVMPGPLKSAEMARQARERMPELAVLFTSGYTENSIVHGGKLDIGVELLSKPYSREAMARKIRHVLNNAKQMKAAATQQEAAIAGRAEPEGIKAGGAPLPTGLLGAVENSRRRVLLVEDNELIRMSEADMLAELGCEVLEAGSAEEALPLLEQGGVEVVVSDLGLPGMSGEDFCREVRRRWPEIGIIFATGMDAGPSLEDASRTALLPKPHGLEELARALQSVGLEAGIEASSL